MRAAVFALGLLALASAASARSLKQDTTAAIWESYSMEPNTFYVSLQMLPQTSKETPEACAEACLADSKCAFWSWCPGTATAGCAIAGSNGTTASTLPAKTCLLSYDASTDSLAVFAMYGEPGTVEFMGGMYQPPEEGEEAAAAGPVKIDVPGVGRRRALLQLAPDQPPSPDDAAWQNYTYETNRFYSGVDRLGWATVETPEACAIECSKTAPDCQFWTFCPKDATAGCSVPSQGGAAPTVQPAGTCITTGDKMSKRTAVFNVLGEGVKWVGGTFAPGNKPPPVTNTTAADGTVTTTVAETVVAGAPPTPNPDDPAAWVDSNPSGPKECSTEEWFSGNKWKVDGEEIECHMCTEGEYQLSCDYDSGWIGSQEINCELDRAGVGSLINNALEFSCDIDEAATPPTKCDWEALRGKLPGCAYEPVRRIISTWTPWK